MTRDGNRGPLPDGYEIRPAREAEAAALRRFGAQLLRETEFFLRGPEERAASDSEMADVIRTFHETASARMLNAWHLDAAGDAPGAEPGAEPVPVAEAVLIPGRLARTRHVATVGVGVLRAHWGRGLARALMAEIEAAARDAGLTRLELTVFAPNAWAQALYERLGYRREGVKRRSVALPSHGPVDEVLMAKLLDEEEPPGA